MKTTLLFVGGGLANGLAAYRMARERPEVSFAVIEAGATLGGNHTWSFHDGDLTDAQRAWLSPFLARSWEGTDVAFPGHRRRLKGRYHAVSSARFHEALMAAVGPRVRLGCRATVVAPDAVTLDSGERLDAAAVIDGRGWAPQAGPTLAWQKFVGLDVTLSAPHGLTRPVIMDATVPQTDGFRFFYLLPWDDTRLLIEDTRYSATPDLDVPSVSADIAAYARGRGWSIASEDRMEAAALPIPLAGPAPVVEEGVAASGLRAGLFHPTTGYSLPEAVRFADALAGRTSFAAPDLAAWSQTRARAHWRAGGFYRLLNRLMFRGAAPETRYRILEGFYRHDEAFIGRFYAGRMSVLDRFRMFAGRPPIPVAAALRALAGGRVTGN